MDVLLNNRVALAVVSAILGWLLGLLNQKLLNKRAVFTYSVRHNRLASASDDVVFGRVQVTWGGTPVDNLYLSTVELRNESLKDFESVTVQVIAADTTLLTERSELVGTDRILSFSDAYQREVTVRDGEEPTAQQRNMFWQRREYRIPTMNRGQIVRVTYLNAPSREVPTITLSLVHKGVRLMQRAPQGVVQELMGVPVPRATGVGTLFALPVLVLVSSVVDIVWLAAVVSMVYGMAVSFAGVVAIRIGQWIRGLVGD